MTNFLTGTNRGLGGLRVDDASTDVFGVNHIVFAGGATLVDNSNGKITVTVSGGGGGSMTSWTVAGASGSTAVTNGQTVTITGSSGITTAEVGRTVTITPTGVLEDLNTLGAPSANGEFIVATGAGAFAYESGATVRTSLGLGTMALEDTNTVTITGGVINSRAPILSITDGGTENLNDALSGYLIFCEGTATLDLAGVTIEGFQVTITLIGVGTVTISAGGGQSINGGASVALSTQYNAVSIVGLDPSTFFAIGV